MKSIHIVEDLLPVAWEKAVVACWEQGESFPTQYDKPNDANSRDVIATIHVRTPFAEPRIHRAFPGGLDDLEKYRSEVLYGVHDHWINPAEGMWEYTYHERLFDYRVPGDGENGGVRHIDQIEECIRLLKACGFTRRAQAVTWQTWHDLGIADPACLQRLWFRVQDGRLNMVVHMRSNDAFKAAFMNMYAFTELQAWVAGRIGVAPGEYCHIADSFHIYGSYFAEFEGFLNTVRTRTLDQKVYTTAFAAPFFLDGCETLLAEPDMPAACREKVRIRKDQLAELTALS
ncbi:MAG: thymidylate synthase [Tepidisphaerales bacterium]